MCQLKRLILKLRAIYRFASPEQWYTKTLLENKLLLDFNK